MRAKRFSALCVFILAAVLAAPFGAFRTHAAESLFLYTNPATGFSVYMDDGQDLLTEAEEASLLEEMKPLTEFGNAGFVSCDNYSESTKSYAARIYGQLYGSESGTMLFIDMGNRELYIKSNGEVSKIISNAYSNTITDNIYKYASRGDYYGCASLCFSQIRTLLNGGRIAQPMRYITAALLALILGLMINYLIVRAVSSPKKADNAEIIDAAKVDFLLRNPDAVYERSDKVYSPVKSGSGGGGGSRGGGGFSGGSGGGHGF